MFYITKGVFGGGRVRSFRCVRDPLRYHWERESFPAGMIMARLAVRNHLPTMDRVPTHNPFIITQQRFLCTSYMISKNLFYASLMIILGGALSSLYNTICKHTRRRSKSPSSKQKRSKFHRWFLLKAAMVLFIQHIYIDNITPMSICLSILWYLPRNNARTKEERKVPSLPRINLRQSDCTNYSYFL